MNYRDLLIYGRGLRNELFLKLLKFNWKSLIQMFHLGMEKIYDSFRIRRVNYEINKSVLDVDVVGSKCQWVNGPH